MCVCKRGLGFGTHVRHSQPFRWEEFATGRRRGLHGVRLIDAFVMECRTVNLVLRLLQRHLPVPWSAVAKQGQQLPGLIPPVPLSFHAPAAVGAAGRRLLDSSVSRSGAQLESGGVGFLDVESTRFGIFFKQPSSPFLSFDRAIDHAARVQAPPNPKLSVAQGSDEPVWGFKLGLRLKSGMYMPTKHEEEVGWEASSVKRKRKKKMNKHKQRKLRRRDRHRN